MIIEDTCTDTKLIKLRDTLDAREENYLSPLACFSRDAIRRHPEKITGHRQNYSLDADRVLHSRAYTRYIDKTQVFYMIDNDHITHRVLHVQLVSKIARTIGRFLGLNEDLIEAIALGHDIGHPPFGHDGEKFLSDLCVEHGLPSFQHNIQSVTFLDRIERGGCGWNLSLQTLDGILCHDGEVHDHRIQPKRQKDFRAFECEMEEKLRNSRAELLPMTLEGCVVRFADTVSYIGRDIEDAIELKLISRDDIPMDCVKLLGKSNGKIVYSLVTDLITNGCEEDSIFFSPGISESLKQLKKFNYERIYLNPAIKKGYEQIRDCYRILFEDFVNNLVQNRRDSSVIVEFLAGMGESYRQTHPPAAIARDYIAGMTDDYFLARAKRLGADVPVKS
ncbi:MAG: HD domain-containing protein [Proteobacteria bacterium]|nr:HD domain-containing protein [Pseudomonadota bacterium]